MVASLAFMIIARTGHPDGAKVFSACPGSHRTVKVPVLLLHGLQSMRSGGCGFGCEGMKVVEERTRRSGGKLDGHNSDFSTRFGSETKSQEYG
jgi:hypothetical protein